MYIQTTPHVSIATDDGLHRHSLIHPFLGRIENYSTERRSPCSDEGSFCRSLRSGRRVRRWFAHPAISSTSNIKKGLPITPKEFAGSVKSINARKRKLSPPSSVIPESDMPFIRFTGQLCAPSTEQARQEFTLMPAVYLQSGDGLRR